MSPIWSRRSVAAFYAFLFAVFFVGCIPYSSGAVVLPLLWGAAMTYYAVVLWLEFKP